MLSYYDRSRLERIMIEELYKEIYTNSKYDIQYYHTPIDSYEVYDSVVNRFEKSTNYLVDTQIFEVKIRDTNYQDILLEKKKYNSLKKESKRCLNGNEITIFYVSCHPSGTYVFNLSKLEDIKWQKESHNISTTELYRGKEDKYVCYLPISSAKFVNIKSTELQILDYIKPESQQIENKLISQQQQKCLFKYLLDVDKNNI